MEVVISHCCMEFVIHTLDCSLNFIEQICTVNFESITCWSHLSLHVNNLQQLFLWWLMLIHCLGALGEPSHRLSRWVFYVWVVHGICSTELLVPSQPTGISYWYWSIAEMEPSADQRWWGSIFRWTSDLEPQGCVHLIPLEWSSLI